MGILEEPAVGGVVVPALADERGADEGGGEAEAQEDLNEKVAVVKHLGHCGGGRRRRCPAIRTFCVVGIDQPGKKWRQCR